ncbi:hypothetical protein KOI35_26675 [Actinoplanes bogorensis]|uniref:GNAT family N-acetyltransferase n=1 Tax=Paractinoplanes bogorensis TaxID=1610840 RepID=A0ABS5YUG8_9ACTN|nr:hypothetical protein [Actinoplanes bogorensis]MBU2667097.1 hypothetical protein [Actinoplanes bogorensis]
MLGDLRRQVFDSGQYYWPPDLVRPTSLEEFDSGGGPRGTHSVLDVTVVLHPEDEDGWGTLRPLTGAQRVELFGILDPTRADFERSEDARWDAGPPMTWCGWAVALVDGSDVIGTGIWGFSGD